MYGSRQTCLTAAMAIWMTLFSYVQAAPAEEPSFNEYEIKAAFMLQFVKFIDGWKFQQNDDEGNNTKSDSNSPIRVGIIGKTPFGDALVPLQNRKIRDRKVVIQYFEGLTTLNTGDKKVTVHPKIKDIEQCDLIFTCSSEKQYFRNILDPLRHKRILTIADTPGFIKNGGAINFVVEENKVRFEINIAAANRAKLKIRSNLLRLAKRVFKTDDIEQE